MPQRRTFSFFLFAACLALSGLLVLRWASRKQSVGPAGSNSSDRVRSGPISVVSPRPPKLAKSRSATSDEVSAAAELHTRLEQALVRRDARPNEAVITFANADAYRRFLARAQ